MLRTVETNTRRLKNYQNLLDQETYQELQNLADYFEGKRVLHINATRHGGGVAVLLRSFIPLLNDLGLEAKWQALEFSDPDFFVATKKIHNGLQGSEIIPTEEEWRLFHEVSNHIAANINPKRWDYIVVHDPQPLGVITGRKQSNKTHWIWRYHGDASRANPKVRQRLTSQIKEYDVAIYTTPQFQLHANDKEAVVSIGFDPLRYKKPELSQAEARQVVADFGVDVERPFICQVSRFDRFKDPVGVIEAWELVHKKYPEVQLVLVGNIADDDPEGPEVLKQVKQKSAQYEDIYIFDDCTNPDQVQAFQTAADVILQKSLREGFGLTVTEGLWAKTPVIGGNVGGIPTQIQHGQNGYLVESIQEAADFLIKLLANQELRQKLGKNGHKTVQKNFLLPHMVKNHLEVLKELG